jgi:4-aminobutyrate aminotransferase
VAVVLARPAAVSPAAPLPGLESLAPVWSHLTTLVVDRASGVTLVDVTGREYLDFTSGIGVTNTGHCHPKVVAAIREQAGRLLHGQLNIVLHEPVLELARALTTVVPENLDAFFFANSGAEAIEAAVKLARRATGKPGIIVFQGGFHGRTHAAMSLTTSKAVYRAGYQPLPAGVAVAPFPYAFRYGWDAEESSQFCLRELRHVLVTQTSSDETAAVLVEPVLGEGGYVVPPDSFIRGVEQLCRELGLLLVLDEVQTGFGRTGRFFALEHVGVRPDILVMAKGMASGMPLSGIAAPAGLMERWPVGSHGGTYGANPVACAAALATIRLLRDERLVENADAMGERLRSRLSEVARLDDRIGEVRGRGLMVATEFGSPGAPDAATARAVQRACIDRGLLLLTCGPYDNVIRWIPPLVVNAAQIDQAIDIFADALKAVR